MAVVVTVTDPGVTVTATPSSSPAAATSSPSADVIAGIIIGTLLGGVLLIILVLYLLNRFSRFKFTRVFNPTHDRVTASGAAPELRHLPSAGSRGLKSYHRHSRVSSNATEPLMYPAFRPPPPSSLRLQSGTPARTNSTSSGVRDPVNDLGAISQPVASGTASSSTAPAISVVPPVPELQVRSSTSPHPRQSPGDNGPPTTSQQNLFIHRMLQSRARASEAVALAYQPSLEISRRTTLDSSILHLDEDRVLAEAERTALRDAEAAWQEKDRMMVSEDDDSDEAESAESIYSQLSAPVDHSAFLLDPVSRQNSSSSLPRRKSSRKRPRAPIPLAGLPPVVEAPDTPRAIEAQFNTRRPSIAGNSSLDGHVSHGTASRPMSSVIDHHPDAFPLLTSTAFGKDSTASGTPPGSISSTAGRGSRSNGSKASRYPSLAPSSVLQSSRSGPRSDAGTDWHHPPSGLAVLTSLQVGRLSNPYSPVEEQPEQPDVSGAPGPDAPVPDKRAHLREGRASSIPEVERRSVMPGGIARIDVAL